MKIELAPFGATVRHKLRTARRVAKETWCVRRSQGWGHAARHAALIARRLVRWYHPVRIFRRYQKNEFDRRFGVETSGILHPGRFEAFGAGNADPNYYKAIRPKDFQNAVGSLAIRHSEFEFVDYGSGKGRALLLASAYPFRRITGVEFSPDLHRAAVANIGRYKCAGQRCFEVHSVCIDASNYDPPESPLVLFFYDPFGANLMSAVLDRLEASYERCPREMFIVYRQPRMREMVSQRRFLDLVSDEPYLAVFRAAPRGERIPIGAPKIGVGVERRSDWD